MAQVLWLMLEDHEAARAKHQANLATIQHLAQIATNNNTMVAMAMMSPKTSLGISRIQIPQPSPSPSNLWMPMIGSGPLRIS
jgi:hypothetical protein